jgi:hypothetical protein
MSKQGVVRALEAMDDPALRARLAGASTGVQAEFDLSNDELDLVSAAASEYPEVEGFSFQSVLDQSALNPLGLSSGHLDPSLVHKIPGRLKWNDITLKMGTASSEPEVVGFAGQRRDPYKNFNFRVVVNSQEIPVPDAYVGAVLYTDRHGWDLGGNKGA